MLDENSQEFYFEEFCYKQFKFKEHNADVKKESLGVVARRQLGGGIGGVGVGDVGVGVGSVSEAGSVGGFDGGVGAFDSGSFLNGFSGVDGGESGSCLTVSTRMAANCLYLETGLGGKGLGLDGGIGGIDGELSTCYGLWSAELTPSCSSSFPGIGKGGYGGVDSLGLDGKSGLGIDGVLRA
jgi:hypothetical protein